MHANLWIFRHGETDWNAERRFQGHIDVPLNDQGRRQAQALAEALVDRGLEVILTSDLLRARETAEIVARRLGVPVVVEPELREIHCGAAEGRLRADVIKEYGDEFWRRWASVAEGDLDLRFPGGESKRECRGRAQQAIAGFLAQTRHGCVAISAHGALVRYLVHACLPEDAAPIAVHNCSVHALRYDRASRAFSSVSPV